MPHDLQNVFRQPQKVRKNSNATYRDMYYLVVRPILNRFLEIFSEVFVDQALNDCRFLMEKRCA